MKNIPTVESKNDARFYNPNTTYYFVSLWSKDEVRWVRCPWLTAEEVRDWQTAMSSDPDNYDRICVMTEDLLDREVYVKDDNSNYIPVSLRTLIYDERYGNHARRIRSEPGYEFAWKKTRQSRTSA